MRQKVAPRYRGRAKAVRRALEPWNARWNSVGTVGTRPCQPSGAAAPDTPMRQKVVPRAKAVS